MPLVRNRRHSGRLGNEIPVIYGEDGWPVPQSITHLAHHNINVDPSDGQISSVTSPVASPSPTHQEEPLAEEPLAPCPPPNLTSLPSAHSSPYISSLPSRRNSYVSRRDPSHVPRPRNAFIFFRSAYISSASAAGEGQQNELSKHAGKAWSKMSPDEKKQYHELADREKADHRIKYPNYVYAPGGTKGKGKPKAAASGRRRSGMSVQNRNQHRQRKIVEQWSRSSSSEPGSPESVYAPPLPRAARIIRTAAQRAAVRLIVRSPSPSPSPRLTPAADERPASAGSAFAPTHSPSPSPSVDDDFVPTSEIPVLELTPSKIKQEKQEELEKVEMKKAPETELVPVFDPAPFHPHLDREPEQFGFKRYITPAAMYASLPTLPRASTDTFSFYPPMGIPSIPIPLLNLAPLTTAPFSVSSLALDAHYMFPSAPGKEGDGDMLVDYYTDQLVKLSTEPVSHEEWCRYQMQHSGGVPQDDVVSMEQYFDFGNFTASA
ncbi:hypothetical protein GALMADRAFT_1187634 [Galerina marginata CBS 339.88]|uniref:HMG box domain-containing protein n=1 Tax=Galerina marginata (strain CBS 339.88) TaxID=685588 RepID=A0A067TAR6_GALM3|nr:hypothetical protein GALMADRAFT_1187634 [Galerina marginata CBS 339.88]